MLYMKPQLLLLDTNHITIIQHPTRLSLYSPLHVLFLSPSLFYSPTLSIHLCISIHHCLYTLIYTHLSLYFHHPVYLMPPSVCLFPTPCLSISLSLHLSLSVFLSFFFSSITTSKPFSGHVYLLSGCSSLIFLLLTKHKPGRS